MLLVIVADLLYRATPLLGTAPFRRDVVPYDASIGTTGKVLRFGEVDARERAAWMSGYLNLYDRRFDVFTAAPLASARYVAMYRKLMQTPTFGSFAYAGVAFILTHEQLPLPWYPVTSAGSVHVFRNPQVYPMAAHFAPGSLSLRRGEWELDTSAARVTINAPSDGIVVLRQQIARGWRVTVDGKPASALAIDGIFRGVNVAKGRHEIVWTYRPPSLYLGAAMTILTLFAMQISAFVKRRKTRATMKNFSSGPSNLE
ncbi:MAG: YfhO family protein [Thermoanaerobaculia bacterium]